MDPVTGEIRMYPGIQPPNGWEVCAGQVLDATTNPLLFGAIGTTYGGDGNPSFRLPDMRGRVAVHRGNGAAFAGPGGTEMVALSSGELPRHTHALSVSTASGTTSNPTGKALAASPSIDMYVQDAPSTQLAFNSVSMSGGSQPHDNRQPYVVFNFIIAGDGATPWVAGEIRVFAFDFVPTGWIPCNGQTVPINTNLAIFSVLGTNFGGDGTTTVGLPDLRDLVVVGAGLAPGQLGPANNGSEPYSRFYRAGERSVSLSQATMAQHLHPLQASKLAAAIQGPAPDRSLARSTGGTAYVPGGPGLTPMAPGLISHSSGADVPHNNVMPSMGFTFAITNGVRAAAAGDPELAAAGA